MYKNYNKKLDRQTMQITANFALRLRFTPIT